MCGLDDLPDFFLARIYPARARRTSAISASISSGVVVSVPRWTDRSWISDTAATTLALRIAVKVSRRSRTERNFMPSLLYLNHAKRTRLSLTRPARELGPSDGMGGLLIPSLRSVGGFAEGGGYGSVPNIVRATWSSALLQRSVETLQTSLRGGEDDPVPSRPSPRGPVYGPGKRKL